MRRQKRGARARSGGAKSCVTSGRGSRCPRFPPHPISLLSPSSSPSPRPQHPRPYLRPNLQSAALEQVAHLPSSQQPTAGRTATATFPVGPTRAAGLCCTSRRAAPRGLWRLARSRAGGAPLGFARWRDVRRLQHQHSRRRFCWQLRQQPPKCLRRHRQLRRATDQHVRALAPPIL